MVVKIDTCIPWNGFAFVIWLPQRGNKQVHTCHKGGASWGLSFLSHKLSPLFCVCRLGPLHLLVNYLCSPHLIPQGNSILPKILFYIVNEELFFIIIFVFLATSIVSECFIFVTLSNHIQILGSPDKHLTFSGTYYWSGAWLLYSIIIDIKRYGWQTSTLIYLSASGRVICFFWSDHLLLGSFIFT